MFKPVNVLRLYTTFSLRFSLSSKKVGLFQAIICRLHLQCLSDSKCPRIKMNTRKHQQIKLMVLWRKKITPYWCQEQFKVNIFPYQFNVNHSVSSPLVNYQIFVNNIKIIVERITEGCLLDFVFFIKKQKKLGSLLLLK